MDPFVNCKFCGESTPKHTPEFKHQICRACARAINVALVLRNSYEFCDTDIDGESPYRNYRDEQLDNLKSMTDEVLNIN